MNKKILSLLLSLTFIIALLPAVSASAVTNYGIFVAGVQITSENKSDVLGDGVFSYDPENKKLTVKGGCECEGNVIKSVNTGLTVYIAKDAGLRSSANAVIYANECDITITGPGKLTLFSSASCIYAYYGAVVTIENATVNATGGNYCFLGAGAYVSEKLIVKDSIVSASASKGAVYDFKGGVTISNCEITDPESGYIKDGGIVDKDGVLAKTVTFALKYDLKVATKDVTSANKNDVLDDGAFSYDPETKTLTVNGGNSCGRNVIISRIQGLTVYVTKDVTLDAGKYAVLVAERDIKITGPGKLKLVTTGEATGILIMAGATLTIENARIEAYAKDVITGNYSDEKLIIKNSYVHVEGSYSAFRGFKGDPGTNYFTITGCDIIDPLGGYTNSGSIADKNGDYVKKVTILKKYDLTIAGTQVTSENYPDVLGDGVFSYDSESNTLNVKGNCMTNSDYVIYNELKDLTINVMKESVLASASSAVVVKKDTVITGEGKMTAVGAASAGIYVNRAALTLDKAKVAASGSTYGVMGSSYGEKLTVKSSDLRASGSSGAVYGFSSGITVTGCDITTPEGGKISGGKILDKNGSIPKTAVLELPKYDIWIVGTQVTAANANDVLGDGGSVKFYDKGNYSPSALDIEYGHDDLKNSRVLVLKDLKLTKNGFYSDGKNQAQIYIGDDIAVVLNGSNVLYKYGTADGVYTGHNSVNFYGNGSLTADAGYYDNDGLYGEGSFIGFYEEVSVILKGAHGINMVFNSDIPSVDVKDNAILSCYAYRTSDNNNFPALRCGDLNVKNNGVLVCEAAFNGDAMSTMESDFPNKYYDVRILKKNEFASNFSGTPTEPYTPSLGLNVKDGVYESDCRYIYIKPKTTYASEVRFSNYSYVLTPTDNGKTVFAYLLPSDAPSLYGGLKWTASDKSVVTVTPKGDLSAVITGLKNGKVTVTATAPGGASASCEVTVTGFDGQPSQFLKGDVNADGKIDATDYILIKRHILKIKLLEGNAFKAADTDGSGKIDATDYISVKRMILGLA